MYGAKKKKKKKLREEAKQCCTRQQCQYEIETKTQCITIQPQKAQLTHIYQSNSYKQRLDASGPLEHDSSALSKKCAYRADFSILPQSTIQFQNRWTPC